MKIFKRIFCSMLVFTIVSTSTYTAYATGFEEVVAVSALGGPEVAIACLAVVGVIIVYDKREEIGSTIDYAVRQSAKEMGIASTQISSFYRKAQSGIIDTSSKVWAIMKSKCQEWTYQNLSKISTSAGAGIALNNVKVGSTVAVKANGFSFVINKLNASAPVGSFTYYDKYMRAKGIALYSTQPFSFTFTNDGELHVGSSAGTPPNYYLYYSYSSWNTFDVKYIFESQFSEIGTKVKELLGSLGAEPVTLLSLGIQKVIDINTKTTVADMSITGDTDIDVNAIAAGVGVRSWEEVMEKVGSGEIALDHALAVEGITDMPIDIGAIPTTAEIAGTITDADRAEVPAVSADSKAKDFSFPIVDLFPFCIPFDVYDFIAAFDAAPIAPSVKLSVNIPVINVPFEYNIDMTVLDPLAATVRNLELIAFLFGLMFITSKMIKW